MGTSATWNGAIGCGKTMPCSSWFCSIAAATMRVMPIPAAHLERTTVARLVEKRRFHGFRILGAQLKDVADLDPRDDFQIPFVVGAGIAGNNLADVCDLPGLREVTSPVDAGEVESSLACAADEIAH